MTNSFYYFFSAAPQVLGGILALFGVFVVFKIQSTKNVLFGIGQNIFDNSRERILSHSTSLSFDITAGIADNIQKGDIKELYYAVKKINLEGFTILKERYISVYTNLQNLIKQTILWSIITTITIVLCLIALPFGIYLINHLYILYALFSVTIISLMICCSGLIYILKKALTE